MTLYNDLILSLQEDVKTSLNDLYKDGKIEVGRTINQKYIILK